MADDPFIERTFRGHRGQVTSVAFSPNQKVKQVASGGSDGYVMLWNFKEHMRAFKYLGHKAGVTHVEYSPDGGIVASASKDRTIRLWVPNARGESTELKAHSAGVCSVSFSRDSRLLISASEDKSAKVWSLGDRRFQGSLIGHLHYVRSARLAHDGRLAVTASDDKTVRLWDVRERRQVHCFASHTLPVTSAQFSPDGTCVASCSADGTIKIFDIRSRSLVQHYPGHVEMSTGVSLPSVVTDVDFHQSGDYLVSCGLDGTTKLWDIREGRLLYSLHSHSSGVTSCAFNAAGNMLATGGHDNLVVVWDVQALAADGEETGIEVPAEVPSKALDHSKQGTDTTSKPSAPETKVRTRPHRIVQPRTEGKATTQRNQDTSAPAEAQPAPTSDKEIPEALTATLDQIVGQLNLISATLQTFDDRITRVEDRLNEVATFR